MQHFDKINENTWTFTCFKINMPFLHKENIIIILESSNYFGMKRMSFDFRSSNDNKYLFFMPKPKPNNNNKHQHQHHSQGVRFNIRY